MLLMKLISDSRSNRKILNMVQLIQSKYSTGHTNSESEEEQIKTTAREMFLGCGSLCPDGEMFFSSFNSFISCPSCSLITAL